MKAGISMIYLDNAATTYQIASSNMLSPMGNPSSPHGMGIRAERAINKSRETLANIILNCKTSELFFTSGGTESNNLALLGYIFANKKQNITIATEPWEHPSVLEPLLFAGSEQNITTSCKVIFTPKENWNRNDINLVSISHVNHETGDINDIITLAKTLKKENPAIIIHVDGVQGFCKEPPIDLTHIDMYTFSGHKCHAPTGIGGIVIKNGVRLMPLMYGGGQENKLRPGTENTQGIIELAEIAALLYASRDEHYTYITNIKKELATLKNDLQDVEINTLNNFSSPYILNMSFLGVKGETLVHLLSEKGIYVSMGAACRSRKKHDQSALEIMGFSQERAQSAIRFSFSHLNTMEEIYKVKEIIIESVKLLRRITR